MGTVPSTFTSERMVQQAKLLPRPKAVPSVVPAPVSAVVPDTAVGVKREAPEAPKAEELPAGAANVENSYGQVLRNETGWVVDCHNLVQGTCSYFLRCFKYVLSYEIIFFGLSKVGTVRNRSSLSIIHVCCGM